MSTGVKVLRWIAVIPAFIALHLGVYWFCMLSGKLWWNSAFAIDIVATIFANMVAPCVVAVKVAPSYKKAVLIILCLSLVIFTGLSSYITILNPNTASTKLIILQVAGIISAICPIIFAWKIKSEEF